MPHIRIVTHAMPPLLVGGTPRFLRTCQGLHKLGWEVSMVGFTDIPELARGDSLPDDVQAHGVASRSFSSRFKRLMGGQGVQFPDRFATLVMSLCDKAQSLSRSGEIPDVTLVSAPSFSLVQPAFLEALRGTTDRLVLELRDAFALNYRYANDTLAQERARGMERDSAKLLDGVVMLYEDHFRSVSAWFPGVRHSALIPNGFDAEGHRLAQESGPLRFWPNREVGQLRLLWVGMAYEGRRPSALIPVLRSAFEQKPQMASVLRFRVVGQFTEEALGDWSAWPGMLETMPSKPYSAMPMEMADADVLTTVVLEEPTDLSGAKVLEYLGARRPVLAIHDGNSIGSLLNITGTGRCFGPEDVQAAAAFLVRVFELWEEDRPFPLGPSALVEPWSSVTLTAKLDGFLREVMGG